MNPELTLMAQQHRAAGRQVVVVQGLGFVGSAVAAAIADAKDAAGTPRYFVIGVDVPTSQGLAKIEKINQGIPPIAAPDRELEAILRRSVLDTGNLRATVDQQVYALADYIIVDVQLDVTNRDTERRENIKLDLPAYEQAIRAIGRTMTESALVLVETTVPMGATERIVVPLLTEERARRGITTPPLVAHAYERVMPGPNYVASIRHFWRTVSAVDERSRSAAVEFLRTFVNTATHSLQELDSPTASELAKLLENSYRAVNIAFIHEWTLLAERIGVDLFKVVNSIRVRKGTHDNMRFPGFGVGGYCLTKDSLLAQWAADHFFHAGVTLEMTLRALAINRDMPLHTFDLIHELAHGTLKGHRVTVCGVSYLPDLSDTRSSPAEVLVRRLREAGADVRAHDSCVTHWMEMPDVPLTASFADALRGVDIVVFAAAHRAYTALSADALLHYTGRPVAIVDAQNAIVDATAEALRARGCRISGVGKGHWRKSGLHLEAQT